jgi:TonB family protein
MKLSIRRFPLRLLFLGLIISAGPALPQSQTPDWARPTYVHVMPLSSSQPHIQVSDGGSCPQPVYPLAAMSAKAEGTTALHLKIDDGGHVLDREVVQKSGATPEHQLLDIALDKAYRFCTFPPAAAGTVRDITLSYAWHVQ